MITPATHWETARLVARPAAVEDAQIVFDHYASDPAVAKYMTWTPHRNLDETIQFLTRCERCWSQGSAFPWTLWHKTEQPFVGLIEIRIGATSADLGYALAQRWCRQGLMTEALTAVVQWALGQPSIYRVWATCDIENIASGRLLERVGMAREGVLRRWLVHPNISSTPRDSLCYSIVKAGYQCGDNFLFRIPQFTDERATGEMLPDSSRVDLMLTHFPPRRRQSGPRGDWAITPTVSQPAAILSATTASACRYP